MNLSPHFTLEELTASQTAARLYLRNDATGRPLVNLGRLANFLEDVRAVLGVPMLISSGYRSMAVNRAVGGSRNSAHMYGLAADFTAPAFGTPREVVEAIAASGLGFDQLILEFDQWVHIAIASEGRAPRVEVLELPEPPAAEPRRT
jgi:hypothetical protein